MRLTPLRRLVIAMLAPLPISYVYLTWAEQLRVNMGNRYTTSTYYDCDKSWQNAFYPCSTDGYTSGWVVFLRAGVTFVLVTAVFVGLLIVLSGWALRPIRSMTEAIGRLGPANLGERLRIEGGRRDEITRLGRELDLLMDRVAEGYEGQRRFAANASHELRTPLAIQRTLIEVSMTGERSADQLDLLARQLLAANERNEALIEGLLVLAETDRGLISRATMRLDEIAAEVLATYESLAVKAGVVLRGALQEVSIEGERVLIERLIGNLVHNGIKYNHAGGSVSIDIGPGQTISVSNTGPVVAADAVGSIFEPFRRLSGDRITHSGGSGLGLTIARSIAQAHGGTIHAAAQVDGGLRVEVAIPALG